MKMSVIVGVYNGEATLTQCVESISRQSITDYELLIVDDASTDATASLCDRLAMNDRHINVIHKDINGGLSSARNAALDIIRGDYVTFVDADDIVEPDSYSSLIPMLEKDADIDILEYPLVKQQKRDNNTDVMLKAWNVGEQEFTDSYAYWIHGKAYNHAYACNKIFRRELFAGIRFPEHRRFEDILILPLLLNRSRKIRLTGNGLYHYFYNPNGITASADGSALADLLDAHIRWISENGLTPFDRDTTLYYLAVLNIQLDVYRLTAGRPLLERPLSLDYMLSLSFKQSIKLILAKILGVKRLCKLHKILFS